jgi:hypothetical protein
MILQVSTYITDLFIWCMERVWISLGILFFCVSIVHYARRRAEYKKERESMDEKEIEKVKKSRGCTMRNGTDRRRLMRCRVRSLHTLATSRAQQRITLVKGVDGENGG